MANSKKSTARRQGLLFAAAFAFVLSACVEIDIPQPQYPAGQGQQPTIVFVDSSKQIWNLDSAFVLNQRIVDSSSVKVNANPTIENNGGTTVINGGSNEHGGTNSASSSTETEVKEIHNGILIKVKNPKKLDLVYHESKNSSFALSPSRINELPEFLDPNIMSIVSIGFVNTDEILQFPMEWGKHYIYGENRSDLVLRIGANFEIVPFDNYCANNSENYISGKIPINGTNSDKKEFRTLAGITGNGELLLLCSNKYLQDAYELLIAYGAIPSQTILLADDNITYSLQRSKMWVTQNYETSSYVFMTVAK